jgi:hypothetical protein
MSVCCSSCIFYANFYYNIPVLVRNTHKECKKCTSNCVSEYDHDYCYKCAPNNSLEYKYHHKKCLKSKKLKSIPENEEINYGILF